MSLTRSMLKAMSIDDEKIDQIIEQHVQTTSELKDERDRYKKEAEGYAEAKKRLQELEDTGEADALRERYEALEKEFSEYKAGIEAEKERAQREALYTELLQDAGVDGKRIKSILKVTDLDALEVSADGTLKDAQALKAKASEEWADFIVTTETRGAQIETPPESTKRAGKAMNKEEILNIKDTAERQSAIAENIDLFRN